MESQGSVLPGSASKGRLHLEAIDGFADVDGVLNLLPIYVTESVVGNICYFDTDDD